MPQTLRSALSTRDNALNFVRLALAVLVIVQHSVLLGGFGPEPAMGDWAVNGFFVLSGYLIAGSRMRLGMREFFLHRALRIFPAFWVVLVGVAFIVAPVTAFFAGWDYSIRSGLGYVVNNAGLWIGQHTIWDTLVGLPMPWSWNGSLWSLVHEFLAYVGAAVLLTGAIRKRPLLAVSILLPIAIAGHILLSTTGGVSEGFLFDFTRLAPFFLAGMLFYFLADRIELRFWPLAAAVGVFLALLALGLADELGQLPFSFVLLWLGARLPVRIGRDNDLSYGIYIWGWPVQQVLATIGTEPLGPWMSALLALLLTMPLAWLSWRLVEKPAMRLRKRVPARWLGKAEPSLALPSQN